MIKLVFGWKDRPDVPGEECDAHYRAVHMDLARQAFEGVDGFGALVYNRVTGHAVNDYNRPEAIERAPDMDAFIELFFDSREQLEAAFRRPIMRTLFDDHPNFMEVDVPANVRIYDVEEVVFHGSRPSR